MATSDAASKQIVIEELTAAGFQPLNPETGGEAEKYAEAIAKAINRIITETAEVPVAGGGSYPGGTFPVL